MKKKSYLYLNLYLDFLIFFFFFLFASSSAKEDEAVFVSDNGGLTDRDECGDRGENVTVDPSLVFESPSLGMPKLHCKLGRKLILSDPFNLTTNWVGSDVCNYTNVYTSVFFFFFFFFFF
ncbi:hypothetical protein NE237_025236 [Protea cynaroides]|uniref:Transmembrane protein n=1 Tax=Protea cynaroides TaxID=273540 RepID=A0A9Q0H2P4_9MAGN|nr:hypothetical protein NE237_025236 [Protea cynaroides]